MNKKVAISGLGVILGSMFLGLLQYQATSASSLKCASSPTEVSVGSSNLSAKFTNSQQAFAFKLFQALQAKNKEENVFISPMSVATVLAMLHNGAEGQTKADITTSLELEGLTAEEINQGYLALQQSLEDADSDVRIAIANSLWMHTGYPIKSQFCHDSATYYRAKTAELDFADPQSLTAINQWVKDNTQQKIQQIIQRLKPNDALVLINALYFKGDWQEQFDESKTREQPFFLTDGQTKSHPLMWQQGDYKYLENDKFQAVNLPYGDGRMGLYVFLPRPNFSLQAFHQELDAKSWNQWLSLFREREGTIELPRFKLESTYQLKESLAALGMEKIFDSKQADFVRLTDEGVVVDRVIHKTFVEVNEKGSEAAAATAVIVPTTVNAPITAPPFSMKVDRPFFITLRDNQTQTLLFLGTIRNP